MRNNQPVTDREYPIRDDQNLMSRTDIKGRITYASPTFVAVSGFRHEELIGAPHNLIRHPDMPSAAFADLWKTLQAGEEWSGLVKNRRKNGDFYWVHAHVVPIIEAGQVKGYTSVRVKPDAADRALAERAYTAFQAGEHSPYRLNRGRLVRRGLLGWLARRRWFTVKHSLVGIVLLGLLGSLGGQWIGLSGQLAGVLLLTGLAGYSYWRIDRSVEHTRRFAMQIAAGNLQAAPPPDARDDLGEINAALILMRRSLANIAVDIHQTLSIVEQQSRELQQGQDALSTRTQQQANSLQSTAASVEELSATVAQNTSITEQSEAYAGQAREDVARSDGQVRQLVTRMQDISERSGQVTQAIEVIDSLAFQTNLLALNASIEAARAGQHGRGFAVVAREVRALASRSASSAEGIRRLIDQSLAAANAGEQAIGQLGEGNQKVIEAVATIDGLLQGIAAASREQSQGLQQINTAMAAMDRVTKQNANHVQQSAGLGASLMERVREVDNAISSLRLSATQRETHASPVCVDEAALQVPDKEPPTSAQLVLGQDA